MIPDSHARLLRQLIEDGEVVSDRAFDALYPPRVRKLSPEFWTPVGVARRAATLLAPTPGTRILDVGAGVGKLCIVAAASTLALVTGIEHRGHLVDVAKRAGHKMKVIARFIHGDLADVDWGAFDAFYFYNPFYENFLPPDARIDHLVAHSRLRFLADARLALEGIARARAGTRVVTYHGLGADLPEGFRLAHRELAGSDELKLWIKHSSAADRFPLPMLRSVV
jgi:SAM-dependent methyltransferase